MDTKIEVIAQNGNRTEDIWMREFQRIAGPDATLSEEAQMELHNLRTKRYRISRSV